MRTAAVWWAVAGLAIGGCSSSPAPETTPEPVPAEAAAPEPTALIEPPAVAGYYRMRSELQRQSARSRGPSQTTLYLSSAVAATPQMGAAGATFNAAVQLTGYTHPPRGRRTQAAGWWPIPGDSLVVQFETQNGDYVQLRGARDGTTLRGDIWYLSMGSGATFQLGTFSATKR